MHIRHLHLIHVNFHIFIELVLSSIFRSHEFFHEFLVAVLIDRKGNIHKQDFKSVQKVPGKLHLLS